MPELNTLGTLIKSTLEGVPDTNTVTDTEKTVLSELTLASIFVSTVTVDATQLSNWEFTPIELVQALGPGIIAWPISVAVSFKNNTADYSAGSRLSWGEDQYMLAHFIADPSQADPIPIDIVSEALDETGIDSWGFWNVHGYGNYEPNDPNLISELANVPFLAISLGQQRVYGSLVSATINSAGLLYAADDVVTVDDATITINTVGGGGEVLTFTITDGGTTSEYGLRSASGGSGSGLNFTLTPDDIDYSANPFLMKIETVYRIFDTN